MVYVPWVQKVIGLLCALAFLPVQQQGTSLQLQVNATPVKLVPGDQAMLAEAYGWKAFVVQPDNYEDGQTSYFEAAYDPQVVSWQAYQQYPFILLRHCGGNVAGLTNTSENDAHALAGVFGLGQTDYTLTTDGQPLRLPRYKTASIVMPARRVRVRLQARDNVNRLGIFWPGGDRPACVALNAPNAGQPGWQFLDSMRLARNTWDTTANWMGRTIVIANLSPNDSAFEVSAFLQ